MAGKRTAIVTGASQGIGAAVVQAFLDRGYSVVATSRAISKANFAPSPHLALVDGTLVRQPLPTMSHKLRSASSARSIMSSTTRASSQPNLLPQCRT
jgi:NAD(P)-dependent dehydrogenase (short-subunit alcohol dehydrogenase family)